MILKTRRPSSIRLKTIIHIWTIVLISLTTLSAVGYLFARSLISNEIDAKMRQHFTGITNKINADLISHSQVTQGIVSAVETFGRQASKAQHVALLERFLKLNDDTFGVGVWFEPDAYREGLRYFGPYVYKKNGRMLVTEDYATVQYDYPSWHWYKLGKKAVKGVAWTDPYYDDYTAITMITASAPFYDESRRFAGVATGDIDLTNLQRIVSEFRFGSTGRAFLLSRDGTFIADRDDKKVMKAKITTLSNPSLAELGRKMVLTESGTGLFADDTGKCRVYFGRLSQTGWILGVVISEQEMFAPLNKLSLYSLLTTLCLLLISSVWGVLIAGAISRPISALNEDVKRLTKEHETAPSSPDISTAPGARAPLVPPGNEIDTLVTNFKTLSETLRGYVSDLESALESLEEQKCFAESLLENSAIATFVINRQHRLMFWNKACEELTGVDSEELIGTDQQWRPFYAHQRQSLADVIMEGNFEALATLYAKYGPSPLIATGWQAEGWYRDLNGKERYVIFDAAPIHDSHGEIAVVVETLQDFTLLKRIEDELCRSERKLRTIIESEPECVMLLAGDGSVLEINPAGLAMIEAEPADLAPGLKLVELIVPEHRAPFEELKQGVFQGRSGKLEFNLTGLKKTARCLDTSAVPLRNADNEIVALLAVARDITEHRLLENQLRHSQKLEAVGHLAGGIAHDFNNILTAIIGFGSLLRMKMQEADPLQKYAEQILLAAERAAKLTQSLLAFSRKQVMQLRPANLNQIVQNVAKLLTRLTGEDVEFDIALCDAELTIMGDSGQVEQVLINLVANARDAMPGGGILSIKTETVDAFIERDGETFSASPGKLACLSVSDSGAGMDEKTRERIFEPFFTTKEVGKGTGLGLSIVYGIVQQHGGSICVYSEPGFGTTFKIYFPVVAGSADPETRQVFLPRGGTETVLLAEDDQVVRTLNKTVLEEFGYTVLEASDGEEAARIFSGHQGTVDLLLLDVIMPKKSGREVSAFARLARPDIKVLFTSGYPAEIISKKGVLEVGVNFVSKPAPPHELLRKVRETLDGAAAPGRAAEAASEAPCHP